MDSLKVFLLSFVLMFSLGVVALAQEMPLSEEPSGTPNGSSPAITQAVNLDENIQSEDLEVSEPKLLPDSPLYFLKNWKRKIQSFFTINPLRKAELKTKFANEKLMEVKKFVELKKEPKIVKKATENYQLERVKKKLEKLGCPRWTPPAPDFCKKGRIVVDERDPKTGCLLPPKCIVPGEVEIPKIVPPVPTEKPTSETPSACITLWDPVCGKDGKTYSNECFAKMARVEIDYKGVCRKKPTELNPIPSPIEPKLAP